MKHPVALTLALSVVWLAWSGHSEGLILGLGAGSVLFVVWLANHMRMVDEESVPLGLRYGRLAAYLPWLAWEIVKANVDVARRILAPRGPDISPRIIRTPASQRTDLGQTIYANSITLTPGTVSIDLRGGEVLVHALHGDAAGDVAEGVMDAKCSALERAEGAE